MLPEIQHTVDGSEIRRSPVEVKVVFSHLIYLQGFIYIQPVVSRISEPSTVVTLKMGIGWKDDNFTLGWVVFYSGIILTNQL